MKIVKTSGVDIVLLSSIRCLHSMTERMFL